MTLDQPRTCRDCGETFPLWQMDSHPETGYRCEACTEAPKPDEMTDAYSAAIRAEEQFSRALLRQFGSGSYAEYRYRTDLRPAWNTDTEARYRAKRAADTRLRRLIEARRNNR